MVSKLEEAIAALRELGCYRIAERIHRSRDDRKLMVATSCFYELCHNAAAYPLRRAQHVAVINRLHEALVELEAGEKR